MRLIDADALIEQMDRNEAIKHLKVVLKTCDVQDEEAVEMAIEALERQRRFYRGSDCLNNRIDTIVPDRDFCSKAERREE